MTVSDLVNKILAALGAEGGTIASVAERCDLSLPIATLALQSMYVRCLVDVSQDGFYSIAEPPRLTVTGMSSNLLRDLEHYSRRGVTP